MIEITHVLSNYDAVTYKTKTENFKYLFMFFTEFILSCI